MNIMDDILTSKSSKPVIGLEGHEDRQTFLFSLFQPSFPFPWIVVLLLKFMKTLGDYV